MANSFLDKTGLSYFWEKVKGRLALKQDKLPTGTFGQMLYQGESGPEWGDKPVMYVNITEDGGTITADKTFNEILQAFNSGYPVIAKYIIDPVANYPILLPLMFAAETAIYFTVYNLIGNQGSHIFIGFLPDGTILKQEQFPEAEHVSFTPGETGLTSNNVQDAIEEVASAQSTAAQLDYSKMKSLHALGITDLNNVVEPGTYVGRSQDGGYPEILNLPTSEIGATGSFWMDVRKFVYPDNPDYALIIQEFHWFVLPGSDPGYIREIYSAGHLVPQAWRLIASPALFTPFDNNRTGLSAENVQDAIEEMVNAIAIVGNGLPKQVSVILTAAGWSDNSQTVTVSGVLADETKQLIQPIPAIASQSDYYEAGILCTGQAADQLTFTCKELPTKDLTVYVVIQGVRS